MELPRDWKLLTEREILGKLYERVVDLEKLVSTIESSLEDLEKYTFELARIVKRNQ